MVKDWDKRLGLSHRVKAGSWAIKLALLPHSPPTWIDSRLVIEDPRFRGQQAVSAAGSSSGPPTSLLEAILSPGEGSDSMKKARPPVEVRLKAREQLTAPPSWSPNSDKSMVVVALEENPLANGLQFK